MGSVQPGRGEEKEEIGGKTNLRRDFTQRTQSSQRREKKRRDEACLCVDWFVG
jgi:hypothetical protein